MSELTDADRLAMLEVRVTELERRLALWERRPMTYPFDCAPKGPQYYIGSGGIPVPGQ